MVIEYSIPMNEYAFNLNLCFLSPLKDDVGNGFPQVVASLFLSPGGPKFSNLMYAYAIYVLTQKLKKQIESK